MTTKQTDNKEEAEEIDKWHKLSAKNKRKNNKPTTNTKYNFVNWKERFPWYPYHMIVNYYELFMITSKDSISCESDKLKNPEELRNLNRKIGTAEKYTFVLEKAIWKLLLYVAI